MDDRWGMIASALGPGVCPTQGIAHPGELSPGDHRDAGLPFEGLCALDVRDLISLLPVAPGRGRGTDPCRRVLLGQVLFLTPLLQVFGSHPMTVATANESRKRIYKLLRNRPS